MTGSKRDLFLITGISGTGKTRFGDTLATDFGFRHYDLEEDQTSNRMFADPTGFIGDILRGNKDTVATWGFNPEHQPSVSLVLQFKNSGFNLIWFDGNRPAALREFIKRATVPEICFYLQMYRIEATNIIAIVNPVLVNPFDALGKFKTASELLEALR